MPTQARDTRQIGWPYSLYPIDSRSSRWQCSQNSISAGCPVLAPAWPQTPTNEPVKFGKVGGPDSSDTTLAMESSKLP
jgi:hypothetical protein